MHRTRTTSGVRATALVLSGALVGCASVEPKGGFDAVQAVAQERLEKKIHWIRGGPEDEAVGERIRAMLADELTLENLSC